MEEIETAVTTAPTVSDVVNQAELDTKAETAAADVVEEKQDEQPKTFSQEEVDAIVQKRLKKEERQVARRVEQQLAERQQSEARQATPRRESFLDDDSYLQAQIEHRAEIRAAEKIAEREHAKEAAMRSESFAEKAEKATDRYADFNEVVSNPSLKINDAMAEFITDPSIDNGDEVAYHLGKNPSKAAQIAGMSVVKATQELMKISLELKSKPAVKTSTAPAPIVPVGSKGRTSPSLANADFADYKKQRAAGGALWSR